MLQHSLVKVELLGKASCTISWVWEVATNCFASTITYYIAFVESGISSVGSKSALKVGVIVAAIPNSREVK